MPVETRGDTQRILGTGSSCSGNRERRARSEPPRNRYLRTHRYRQMVVSCDVDRHPSCQMTGFVFEVCTFTFSANSQLLRRLDLYFDIQAEREGKSVETGTDIGC